MHRHGDGSEKERTLFYKYFQLFIHKRTVAYGLTACRASGERDSEMAEGQKEIVQVRSILLLN